MSDIKFVIIDKPDEDLSKLSTSELADRADAHNPQAYAKASEQDLPEDQFRAALLEILGGVTGAQPVPFGPVRTAQVASLVDSCGGDLWGEHPQYPKSDWKYEVENGDTFLGYWEWVYCKLDEADA